MLPSHHASIFSTAPCSVLVRAPPTSAWTRGYGSCSFCLTPASSQHPHLFHSTQSGSWTGVMSLPLSQHLLASFPTPIKTKTPSFQSSTRLTGPPRSPPHPPPPVSFPFLPSSHSCSPVFQVCVAPSLFSASQFVRPALSLEFIQSFNKYLMMEFPGGLVG